jgi:CRP-like cAMP-binding protein
MTSMKKSEVKLTHPVHMECSKCESKSKSFMCSTSDGISQSISAFKAESRYQPGDVIFRAGDAPLGLFSIRSGVVKLESLSEDGDAHTLKLVGAGGLLGYRSFFRGDVYNNSAIAMEPVEVCFLPRKDVLELFNCHPELGLKLINQLSSDLDRAESKWIDQIDKGAPARIADALLFLDENFRGTSWTRKEIAEWAGTTTETVIRTLAQFEKEGLIKQNYKNFTVLTTEKLNQRANS